MASYPKPHIVFNGEHVHNEGSETDEVIEWEFDKVFSTIRRMKEGDALTLNAKLADEWNGE